MQETGAGKRSPLLRLTLGAGEMTVSVNRSTDESKSLITSS